MSKFLKAISMVAVAGAMVSAPALAQAQVVTPAPSTWRLQGDLTLQQTRTLNCQATFNVSVNADGATGWVTSGSFSMGDLGCGFPVYPRNFSWPVTFTKVSATTATVSLGADVNAFLGTCLGTLTGLFDETTQEVTFSSAPVSGSPSTCYVSGVLEVTPTGSTTGSLQVL